jgi:hypothetical protein
MISWPQFGCLGVGGVCARIYSLGSRLGEVGLDALLDVEVQVDFVVCWWASTAAEASASDLKVFLS